MSTVTKAEKAQKVKIKHVAAIALMAIVEGLQAALNERGDIKAPSFTPNEGESPLDFVKRVQSEAASFAATQESEPLFIRETVLDSLNEWVKDHAPAPQGERKRAVITDAIKAKMDEKLKAGVQVSVIATELCVSAPTVHTRKRELGLTRPRGQAVDAAPAGK